MRGSRIEIIHGDITTLIADAIVNAANKSLTGGGGVDGAIHRAAGPDLLAECITLGGCEAGQAKITSGYDLPSSYVIHTVGPVWKGGYEDEHRLLASCYTSSLKIASERKLATLVFPGISTGIYGFPKEQAANIALTETKRFLQKHRYPEKVMFVTYDEESFDIYTRLMGEL